MAESSMKLYRETPCSHGEIFRHWTDGMPQDKWCPGGSREEVTIDYETAIAKHNELYPVPLSARGEEWTRQVIDAALNKVDVPADL